MSNVPMTHPERALAIHDQQHGHAVTFARLPGERILLGTGSQFRVSDDGGLTWGEPYTGSDESGAPLDGGCASLVNLCGEVLGIATTGRRPGAVHRYDAQMVFRTSQDEGRHWSPPVVMNGSLPAFALQDVMLRTTSGRIVLPVYFAIGQGTFHHEGAPFAGAYLNGNFVSTDAHFYDPHFGASYVLYSDDEGQTWQPNRDGELLIVTEPGGPFEVADEPSVAEVAPGLLLMVVRTRLGRLFQSWSKDNGETWSRLVATQLAGTQAPGQLRRLPNGHLLVVWTQQSHEEIRRGCIRTRLSAAISRNGGGLWEHFQNVESLHEETHVEPGPVEIVRPEGRHAISLGAAPQCDARYAAPLPGGYGRWSYPSVFVNGDRVLISHTYSVHDSRTGEVCTPPGASKLKVLPLSWFYGDDDPQRDSALVKKLMALAPAP
ncbi:MAG: sialidase family protein [Candidatus Latescibacterota bacterium]